MASIQHAIARRTVKSLIQNLQIKQSDIPLLRRWGDLIISKVPIPLGTSVQEIKFPNFGAELIRPAYASKDKILLYMHGGGYVLGSAKTHRAFVAKIAKDANIRALSLDYRLAPDHPFPAALDDVLEAYEWLTVGQGFHPKQIVMGGDSAGGGLVLATLLALREKGVEMPLAAFCIAPWTDLMVTGQSVWENKEQDTMLQHFDIPTWAKMYYHAFDPHHPLVSPLYADLHGLPPILMQVSEDEILRDDAIRFAWKAHAQGVQIELQKWKGLIHCWQMFWQYVPEGRDAIKEIVAFIQKGKHGEKHPIVANM